MHACCIDTHIVYKAPREAASLKTKKKQWQGSPMEIQTFHQGLFLSMRQSRKTALKLSVRLHRGCKFATSS